MLNSRRGDTVTFKSAGTEIFGTFRNSIEGELSSERRRLLRDLAHQLALLAHFRDLAAQGLGVVLVLHDLAQAMNHADRVLVLSQGKLVEDGPPAEALRGEAIQRHWGVQAQWLGKSGAWALAIG